MSDNERPERIKPFCIYKANNNKSGAAAQFKLADNLPCVFLEVARQINDREASAPYDWANKITVKLGDTDIGKILLLLNGQGPEQLELIHKSPKGGTKYITLQVQERGIFMQVNSKAEDGTSNRVSFPIGYDEAGLLKLALERAYLIMLGW